MRTLISILVEMLKRSVSAVKVGGAASVKGRLSMHKNIRSVGFGRQQPAAVARISVAGGELLSVDLASVTGRCRDARAMEAIVQPLRQTIGANGEGEREKEKKKEGREMESLWQERIHSAT